MRKQGFSTAVLATIITASIALTGCTATADPYTSQEDIVQAEETDWQVHFNRETGKITAIFDHNDPKDNEIYRDATFNQEADFSLPFNFWEREEYTSSYELDGTVNVHGEERRTKLAKISWSLGSMNWEDQAKYYNAHIASPEHLSAIIGDESDKTRPIPPYQLTTDVLIFIREEIRHSSIPIPKFGTNGKATTYTGPDFLVEGHANGVEPKDLVLQLTGTEPNPDATYAYMFNCATYEVVLENGAEIQNWIDTLPANADGVHFSIYSGEGTATVATEQPCDIAVENPMTTPRPPKDDSKNPSGDNG